MALFWYNGCAGCPVLLIFKQTSLVTNESTSLSLSLKQPSFPQAATVSPEFLWRLIINWLFSSPMGNLAFLRSIGRVALNAN